MQTRKAVCVDELEQIVDDSLCANSEKIVEKLCVLEKCSIWSIGEWSTVRIIIIIVYNVFVFRIVLNDVDLQCSVSCGFGERVRQVRCQQGNRIVPMYMCSASTKPSVIEACEMPSCATWSVGKWSNVRIALCGTVGTVQLYIVQYSTVQYSAVCT